ncbi:helix-hairpin-helix domain-containing protein, partial [Streptomyces goshikiensis]
PTTFISTCFLVGCFLFFKSTAGGVAFDSAAARAAGERLRADIRAATGLSGSVGLAGSKMLAKVASEEAKPAGLLLIEPGTERELLAPMSVRTLPGVGPVTGQHLRRAGITTVGELAEAGEDELVRMLGRSHGVGLHRMALGLDDRPVVAERDTKSVSVEDTFDVDLHDRVRIRYEVQRLADRCVGRLRDSGHSGRTIVLKVRRYDFSTLTRSETLRGPTDDVAVVREAAARLLESVDTTGGVRLLGVGVSGLADYTQEDLFAFALAAEGEEAGSDPAGLEPAGPDAAGPDTTTDPAGADGAVEGGLDGPAGVVGAPGALGASGAGLDPVGGVGGAQVSAGADGAAAAAEVQGADGAPGEVVGVGRRWGAGSDVRHAVYGAGWVQGSGVGRVTVRFERPGSGPGRVRTFRVDDPELTPSDPLPLVGDGPAAAG